MMPTPMGADMMIQLSGNPALRASTSIPHGGRIIQVDARHLIASIAVRLRKKQGGGMGLLAAVGGGEQQAPGAGIAAGFGGGSFAPNSPALQGL